MLRCAEPRTIQAVVSCGTKSCSSVTKTMEHFQTLYPTSGAEGTAKSILRRVPNCVSGCAEAGKFETEHTKSKPVGNPLVSLCGREARGVLVIWSRPRGPRSEMWDVSVFYIKDFMDMDLGELIHKYNRTVRATELLRYMLEADHRLIEELEQKTWSPVRQSEFQDFQAWKRHKVWCFLRFARDTRCLFDCPWQPLCLFYVFRMFRVLSLVLAPGTQPEFSVLHMYSMLRSMPLQPPLVPEYPSQCPGPYQPQYAPQYRPPYPPPGGCLPYRQ